MLIECGRLLDHAHYFVPDDFRLVFFGCCAVDFRARLPISYQQIQGQACRPGRFPILSRDDEDELPILPQARVFIDEAEEGSCGRLLPQFQFQRLATPGPFRLAAECLYKFDDVLGFFVVVYVLTPSVVQFIDQMLVYAAHFFRYRHTTVQDLAIVLFDVVHTLRLR